MKIVNVGVLEFCWDQDRSRCVSLSEKWLNNGWVEFVSLSECDDSTIKHSTGKLHQRAYLHHPVKNMSKRVRFFRLWGSVGKCWKWSNFGFFLIWICINFVIISILFFLWFNFRISFDFRLNFLFFHGYFWILIFFLIHYFLYLFGFFFFTLLGTLRNIHFFILITIGDRIK